MLFIAFEIKEETGDGALFTVAIMIVLSTFASAVLLGVRINRQRSRLVWEGCLGFCLYHFVTAAIAFYSIDLSRCIVGPVIVIQMSLAVVWIIAAPVAFVNKRKLPGAAETGTAVQWDGLFY